MEEPGRRAPPSRTRSSSPASARPRPAFGQDIGCPYEAALALADADEEEPLRQALEQLQPSGRAARGGDRRAAAARARRARPATGAAPGDTDQSCRPDRP